MYICSYACMWVCTCVCMCVCMCSYACLLYVWMSCLYVCLRAMVEDTKDTTRAEKQKVIFRFFSHRYNESIKTSQRCMHVCVCMQVTVAHAHNNAPLALVCVKGPGAPLVFSAPAGTLECFGDSVFVKQLGNGQRRFPAQQPLLMRQGRCNNQAARPSEVVHVCGCNAFCWWALVQAEPN